ncbi:MAG: hypothetical protein ACO29C_04475 [Fluviibacter sp.]
MSYYKDQNNQLHWLDSAEFEYLLPEGSILITDIEAEAIREANKPEPLPITEISPRQIRMALTQFGLRSQVETAISASDQDMKDWYEFSTYFDRNHPQVLAMATALNVTEADLDALWKLGATL